MSHPRGNRLWRIGGGLAASALLVASVTVVARGAGFVRQLLFQANVGETDLGAVYTTANYLPNILFEIAAGGALASAVVPVLAGAAARRDHAQVRQTTAGLLGWTLLILIPLAAVGALLARPFMWLLLGGAADEAMVDVGSRMLLVFLPQIPLYGLAVVTAGVLQAHRRFFFAAIAPVVSSLVVATAYVAFGATFTGDRNDLGSLDRGSELLLSVGTTLGVLALALTTLVPVLVRGTSAWPSLRFPAGVAGRVRVLALAGVSTVLAQQLAMLVVVRFANVHGGRGALVTYQNSWMVYLLPYAVLAVPIATSAFPRLAAHADKPASDRAGGSYARTAAASTRGVIVAGAAGAALLVATARPIATFFALIGSGDVPEEHMTRALVAFAPGLIGYGLVAHLGRVLYARHEGRAAARSTVIGWIVVGVASGGLAVLLPEDWTVAGLGLANAIGMTLAGILLVHALHGSAGAEALTGVGRTSIWAVTAATFGGALGAAAANALPTGEIGTTVITGMVAALVGLAAFAVVVFLTNRSDLLALRRRGRTE